MLALVLVAVSVGFSNLAASIGLGAAGVDQGTRLRIVLIFGLFEAGMPIVGLLIGHDLASSAGRETRWLAAGLLAGLGSYGIVRAARSGMVARRPPDGQLSDPRLGDRRSWRTARLLVSGLALSLDNLVAGFALGAYHVSILVGAVIFGTVSVAMSLAGLEFGARLGRRSGERGELIGGVVLIGVAVAIGFGALG